MTFADDFDLPLTLREFLSFRGALRLVFRDLVETIPCLWSRILLTPNTNFEFARLCFSCARQYPLQVHVRSPSNFLYFPDEHDGHAMYQQFRRLIQLVVSAMSSCEDLIIETGHLQLLDIATEELAVTSPFILSRFSVVMPTETADFRCFQPTCLTSQQPPLFGQPFIPLVHLTIVHDDVRKPVFTHVAMQKPFSVVQLPMEFTPDWRDLIHLLLVSDELNTLVLNSVKFRITEEDMVAAPPMHVQVLDVAFSGLQTMADVITHIPFPQLSTLKVYFVEEEDVQCLARCSNILGFISELVLLGIHPEEGCMPDLFRFCFRVEVLNMREAQTEFFSSFFRASNRLGAPGFANYNVCPVLRHLITSGVSLRSIRELLDTRQIFGYPQLDTVTALRSGDHDPALITWFTTRSITLNL
ncbi:hypothetical protein C8J57DRAFT_1503032 [Mycena rebaudengoi]|nr:hypothetical protein C8J57DRAFT_1503032 [Mycena rebaudengoi]